MSIKLHGTVQSFSCGDGNRLFQYLTALIYAEKNNLYLINTPNIKCLEINYDKLNENKVKKDEETLTLQHLNSGNFNNDDELQYFGDDKLYWITDFFQNANYLNKNYEIIMKYVILKPPIQTSYNYREQLTGNEILCILRLGEIEHELVNPEYFINIFEKNNFNKIYFLIYPKNDKKINKYLSYLKKYNDKIILLKHNNALEDFYCVNNFKYIASSISTYNWWSIYFINNIEDKIIYTPNNLGDYYNVVKKVNCKRGHCKNLWNIRNKTIPIENNWIILN